MNNNVRDVMRRNDLNREKYLFRIIGELFQFHIYVFIFTPSQSRIIRHRYLTFKIKDKLVTYRWTQLDRYYYKKIKFIRYKYNNNITCRVQIPEIR